MVRRQLSAAMLRSASVICTCTILSASAKLVMETSGPTSGPVPKAGGSPGGKLLAVWLWPRRAAAPRSPSVVVFKNRRRERDMKPPNEIRRDRRSRVMAGEDEVSTGARRNCQGARLRWVVRVGKGLRLSGPRKIPRLGIVQYSPQSL